MRGVHRELALTVVLLGMPIDTPEHVPSGVACGGCGYELAGLPVDGVCPECAHPIWKTLERPWLRFADVGWLERVELGLRIQCVGQRWVLRVWMGLLGLLLLVAIPMIVFDLSDANPSLAGAMAVPLVKCAWPLPGAAVLAIASQWFGVLPQLVPGTRQRRWSFVAVRVCSVVHLAGMLYSVWNVLDPGWLNAQERAVLGTVFLVNGGILIVALLQAMEDLERKTPQWTAQRVGWYLRCLLFAGVVVVMFGSGATGYEWRWGGGAVTLALACIGSTRRVYEAVRGELEAARGTGVDAARVRIAVPGAPGLGDG